MGFRWIVQRLSKVSRCVLLLLPALMSCDISHLGGKGAKGGKVRRSSRDAEEEAEADPERARTRHNRAMLGLIMVSEFRPETRLI